MGRNILLLDCAVVDTSEEVDDGQLSETSAQLGVITLPRWRVCQK